MSPWLENTLLWSCDKVFSAIPQKKPEKEQIASCRIVSHRGERNNIDVFENTLKAFDPIIDNNIWGIEFDVRWTKDLVPVVIHDTDCVRVFNKEISVTDSTWKQLKQNVPEIPSLEELVERYQGKAHLMIELKQENYPKPAYQRDKLKEIMSQNTPCADYHFIALETEMFKYVDFVEQPALLPVSTTNAAEFSRYTLEHNTGGLTGHYLFVSESLIEQHKNRNQKIGTGFINSKNVMFREINKNVDWLFTNEALKINRFKKDYS